MCFCCKVYLVIYMKKENKIYNGKLVNFYAKDGIRLSGFLVGRKRAQTCAIFIHGMTGNFYGFDLPFLIADKLAKKDTALFTLNTRGHDMAARIYGYKNGKKIKLVGGTDFEKFEDSVLDIDGAIKIIEKKNFKKFILIGHSTGCQKVTYYQYKKRNKKVLALVLLAPCDDYNLHRKELGSKFAEVVKTAKTMVKNRKGNEVSVLTSNFSAKRFLSVADTKNVEARLFDYDGKLDEFSKIKIPILAVFGSREQFAVKPVKTYLKMLGERTKSEYFESHLVKGAKHSFENHEEEVSNIVAKFISKSKSKL